MWNLSRRKFLKVSSATLFTTALPLNSPSVYAKKSLGIEPRELPGFEGKFPAAVAISGEGKIFGLIKDENIGIIDSEGQLLSGMDRAVRWNEDLSYEILDGPNNSTNAQMSQALGTSPLGVACGVYQNKKGVLNASLWTAGKLEVLSGLKNNERSKALGCNDKDLVVGVSTENKFDFPVYWNLKNSVKAKKLLTPEGFSGSANGVNDTGIIVGQITQINGVFGQAAIWENFEDSPVVLTVPRGVEESLAVGMSAGGTIFGAVKNSQGRYQASYWDGDNFNLVTGLGNSFSKFLSVNTFGVAVGNYITGARDIGAFVYKDGRVRFLKGLGGNKGSVISINDNNIACGVSEKSNGEIRAATWDVSNV
ncbi:hypothetical protein [Vibrio pectenicida]|uniref:DUF3466 family protein n=1 Tax=Vibrio pectenicida TaxID=62763 RepID=A0A427U241_9VIBR|nr:hypothetical protein [Vibrio pectenicida]RSD30695.1 hypothetical protein EJA03_12655 [Vibrio pectenicida]RSD31608.1 hypothetical protein EJA03_07985 [Vibrio pectenicida]